MRRSESFLTAILFIQELIFRRLVFSLMGSTILGCASSKHPPLIFVLWTNRGGGAARLLRTKKRFFSPTHKRISYHFVKKESTQEEKNPPRNV
jgi:hypothetical protein